MSFDYVTDENHETMKALITTEGILFHDEQVKKFYLIIKYYTIEIFENVWNILGNDTSEYCKALDSFETLVDDTLSKKHEEIESEFQNIVILYTKYIFKGNTIRLKKPKLNDFLKAFFEKFKNIKFVRNGTFFQSSMVEQDFLFRDLFRQTLFSDCIKITQRKTLEMEAESVLPKFSVISGYSKVHEHLEPSVVPSEKEILKTVQEEIPFEKNTLNNNVTNLNEIEKNVNIEMKNETKSKNVIKSFHSFSLPPEKIEAYEKAPSEILMNFIQEEEFEEEKVKEGDLDKELKKESKEESKQNYENVDCKKEKKDEFSVKENNKEFDENEKEMDFHVSDEEDITEDDSISRVMEKMYMQTLENVENPEKKKKIKKIILN